MCEVLLMQNKMVSIWVKRVNCNFIIKNKNRVLLKMSKSANEFNIKFKKN